MASPASFIARWRDAVPADNATAYRTPTLSAINRSTSLIFFPTVDIQFVSYASVTYFNSSPCIVGDDSQILCLNGSIIISSFLPFAFNIIKSTEIYRAITRQLAEDG